MVQASKKPAAGVKGKKKPQTFVIDCAKPVEDKIMEIGTFEKYLQDKIKINNKTGGLSADQLLQRLSDLCGGFRDLTSSNGINATGLLTDDLVTVTKDKTKITVTSEIPMSKRWA